MEDKEACIQIHQQEQTEDENEGLKFNSMLDEKQSVDGTEEKATTDKGSTSEKGGSQPSNASKKPKQSARPTHKSKTTVPQPFFLATEQRMSRERHGSMDLSSASKEKSADMQSKLSKSASFSHKALPSQMAREASNLKRSATATPSFRPEATSRGRMDKKTANAAKIKDKFEVEGRNLQSNSKKQAKESEKSKLEKSFTFKASPLPSFYHRKDPPSKPEMKKIPSTRPKSPVLGRRHRNKSSSNTENSKTENKEQSNASTGISDIAKETSANTEKTKTDKKGKSNASTGISNSAKETLSRFIKGTKKVLNTSKETMKLVVSKA